MRESPYTPVTDPIKISYIAALLDVSGCYRIGKFRRQNGSYTYYAAIIIYTSHPKLIKFLNESFNTNRYFNYDRKPGPHGSSKMSSWCARGKLLHHILTITEPYIISSKPLSSLLLQFCNTIDHSKRFRGTPDHMIEEREAFLAEYRRIRSQFDKRKPLQSNYEL